MYAHYFLVPAILADISRLMIRFNLLDIPCQRHTNTNFRILYKLEDCMVSPMHSCPAIMNMLLVDCWRFRFRGNFFLDSPVRSSQGFWKSWASCADNGWNVAPRRKPVSSGPYCPHAWLWRCICLCCQAVSRSRLEVKYYIILYETQQFVKGDSIQVQWRLKSGSNILEYAVMLGELHCSMWQTALALFIQQCLIQLFLNIWRTLPRQASFSCYERGSLFLAD